MVKFNTNVSVMTFFCYGVVICDTDWIIENCEKIDENKYDEIRDYIYHKTYSNEFKEWALDKNVLIKKWKFEDCGQILLAHKDMYIETEGIETFDIISVSNEDTSSLVNVLSHLHNLVKDEMNVNIDFNVDPEFILHLYYD